MHACRCLGHGLTNRTAHPDQDLCGLYLRHHNGNHLPRPSVKCIIAVIMANIKEIDPVGMSEKNSASTTDRESNVVVKMTAKGIPLVPQPSDDPDDPLVHTFMCRNQHYATV